MTASFRYTVYCLTTALLLPYEALRKLPLYARLIQALTVALQKQLERV